MPLYTLLCRECGNRFEQMASMKEKEERRIACPACGSQDCVTDYQAGSAHVQLKRESGQGCPHAGSCGCGCHGGR